MTVLLLEVREYAGRAFWRWVLTDPASGLTIADHAVRLDTLCWQFEALIDPAAYVAWHAAPDQRAADTERILTELGAWITSEVLGPVGPEIARRRSATVRIVAPEEARELLSLPLELARVGARPLGLSRISFVREVAPRPTARGRAGERLRVLGLFSLPEGGQPLNLRRQRYSLVQLVRGLTATGKAADVRVLQYGVTRDRLRDVLAEAEGWDIIHVSGHGTPGELLLETAAGAPDHVRAADLADLLDLARARAKLVTVAGCWSATATTAEQRRLLGLPVPEQTVPEPEPGSGVGPEPGAGPGPEALGALLATRLGCAVLTMRYPVSDDFASAFCTGFYDRVTDKGRALPEAVSLTQHELTGRGGASRVPLLSLFSPVLFSPVPSGDGMATPGLAAPARSEAAAYDAPELKMAGFPPQPARFVGRTGVMARASAALAAESGVPGVLLHGMPGSGKTACALELAYGHEHAFDQLIWYKAPDEGMDVTGALTDFTLTLEHRLPGLQIVHMLGDADKMRELLLRLTDFSERNRALIVIDNAESLLADDGQWGDAAWGQIIGALTPHAGSTRLILTSRRVPTTGTTGTPTTGASALRLEAVDALPADEALLLARELPHLRALIDGEVPGAGRGDARRLALGVLNAAQGHPKLLELADGQAARPERLAGLLAAGDRAWRDSGGLPDSFFLAGDATADPGDYLRVLGAWTETAAQTLAPGERDLFWFLCCLEEPDRTRPVLDGNWASLWTRLGRAGQAPDLDQALAAIAASGLAARRPGTGDEEESCAIHPGVAGAGRAHAGQPVRGAVDREAAAYWSSMFLLASGEYGNPVDTGLLVRAGLASVPYLMRQEEWAQAAYMLEYAFARDPSRANAATVLPAIRRIAAHDPRQAGVLARILQATDPAEAETQLRAYLDAALAQEDYRAASATAGQLTYLCRSTGRLAQALSFAQQAIGYTRRAGAGPWTQLSAEVQRLQVLNAMGQARQVLDEVERLTAGIGTLPDTADENEDVPPWNVRETLLDTGRSAARLLGRWDDALALNAAQAASMRDRRAPAVEIAQARFNDYGPLLRLGRIDEVLDLLQDCRQAFQDARDVEMLGKTLTAVAGTEDVRGHADAAIRLEHDALRYKYLAGDVHGIAVSYHNLGNYLRRHPGRADLALASHLAAALIWNLSGADTELPVRAAGIDLSQSGGDVVPPTSVADLSRLLADIPGTDLARLIGQLSPDAGTAGRALGDLSERARESA